MFLVLLTLRYNKTCSILLAGAVGCGIYYNKSFWFNIFNTPVINDHDTVQNINITSLHILY